jgi:hypothetical protein
MQCSISIGMVFLDACCRRHMLGHSFLRRRVFSLIIPMQWLSGAVHAFRIGCHRPILHLAVLFYNACSRRHILGHSFLCNSCCVLHRLSSLYPPPRRSFLCPLRSAGLVSSHRLPASPVLAAASHPGLSSSPMFHPAILLTLVCPALTSARFVIAASLVLAAAAPTGL